MWWRLSIVLDQVCVPWSRRSTLWLNTCHTGICWIISGNATARRWQQLFCFTWRLRSLLPWSIWRRRTSFIGVWSWLLRWLTTELSCLTWRKRVGRPFHTQASSVSVSNQKAVSFNTSPKILLFHLVAKFLKWHSVLGKYFKAFREGSFAPPWNLSHYI